MLAVKELYNYIKTRLFLEDDNFSAPLVKHFDWWNENVLNEAQGTPYNTPAVFFELTLTTWERSTKGNVNNQSTLVPEQKGDCEFTLHIIYKKIDSSAIDESELNHLDVVEDVYKRIHGAPPVGAVQGFIQRLRDETVLVHTVLRDYPLTFSAELFECAAEDQTLTEVTPWGPVINTEQDKPYLSE